MKLIYTIKYKTKSVLTF